MFHVSFGFRISGTCGKFTQIDKLHHRYQVFQTICHPQGHRFFFEDFIVYKRISQTFQFFCWHRVFWFSGAVIPTCRIRISPKRQRWANGSGTVITWRLQLNAMTKKHVAKTKEFQSFFQSHSSGSFLCQDVASTCWPVPLKPAHLRQMKFSGERRRCKHCLIYKPDRPAG